MAKMVNNTDIFINACNEQIERALESIGLQAETYSKLLCPVDTGRLQNSITHTIRGKAGFKYQYTDNNGNAYDYDIGNAPENKKTVYIGTNVDYAPDVEFGTTKQRAKPYLKPAVTDHNEEYRAIALSNLRQ